MQISQTTINMAARRNVSIVINERDMLQNGHMTAEFAGFDEDGEAIEEFSALYEINDEGMFFVCSCRNGEEWPNWIPNEKTLRGLLDAMNTEING